MRLGEYKKRVVWLPAIVAVAAVLPYILGLDGEFVFDDVPLIKNDPFYKTESNPLKCWTRSFWKENQTQGLYRPVTLFSYWLDARIFSPFSGKNAGGLYPPGFRLVNLLLHAAVSVMLFLLAVRLSLGRPAAFTAALIYAVHPIHVEAVTPAFGRGELLCAFFLLAGLLFHLRRPRSIGKGVWKYAGIPATAFCFLLSFMSKEHGAAFLPICVLIDAYRFRGKWTEKLRSSGIWRRYALYVAAVAIVFAARRLALGSWLPKQQFFDPFIDNIIALSPPHLRVVSAIRLQGLALFKFLYPATLSSDYSYAQFLPSKSVFDSYAWLTLALFATVPALFIKFAPRRGWATLLLITLFIVSILPGGNFIVPGGTVFAERLQYLPSIWLAMFAGLVVSRVWRAVSASDASGNRRRLVVLAFTALIAAFAARTTLRTLDWKDDTTLSIVRVKTAPSSVKALNNYAVVMGKTGHLKEAVAACSKAIAIHPKYATAYANRGLYLAKMGYVANAVKDFKTALRLSQYHPVASYSLGVILANRGKIEEARALWLNAAKAHPDYPPLKRALEKSNRDRSK